MMIKYPMFEQGTIGVTAPSSGVGNDLHHVLQEACNRMTERGFKVVCGDTAWTQNKAKSASAKQRAEELNHMLQDENIDIVIPPWGGELLIETLEYIDFENMKQKWVLGYSDTSLLLLAITLKTGIATAHGTNFVDIRGEFMDDMTAMWQPVLATKTGDSITQYSSKKYQKEWRFDQPSPCVFHLTEETKWKSLPNSKVNVNGRLLGGCIDVIRHIIGTPYGDVRSFRKRMINEEPILWYLENCDLSTTDLRRSLVQMKLAGWFEGCSGIMFGRSDANASVDGYEVEDVYQELFEELQIPIIYDVDCGHMPPQLTLVNGAFAKVEVNEGKGTIVQLFKE